MVVDSTQTLVLRRRLKASPERVFTVWTTPEHMRQWFRPSQEFSHTEVEVDLRVGGRFHVGFVSPDGTIDNLHGEFLAIDRPHRLVYSWTWEKPNEHGEIETQVTVEFRAVEDGTELVLTHTRFADDAMRDRHNGGWSGALDLLAELLSEASRDAT